MTDLLHRLAGTVLLRPYVFVFLLAYLFLAVARLGWLRTLVWTVTAYLIAWAVNGVPFTTGFPSGGTTTLTARVTANCGWRACLF